MAIWTCVECSLIFKRDKSGSRPIRFCGNVCYHKWQKKNPNVGQFKLNQETWNKGLTGMHFSPKTEFKKGGVSARWLPVGSERIRLDKKTKTPRMWVKTTEPNIWKLRAVLVWEQHNGPVPNGLVIHHKDHDSMHDAAHNLVALTRKEHIAEHHDELAMARARIQAESPMFANVEVAA